MLKIILQKIKQFPILVKNYIVSGIKERWSIVVTFVITRYEFIKNTINYSLENKEETKEAIIDYLKKAKKRRVRRLQRVVESPKKTLKWVFYIILLIKLRATPRNIYKFFTWYLYVGTASFIRSTLTLISYGNWSHKSIIFYCIMNTMIFLILKLYQEYRFNFTCIFAVLFYSHFYKKYRPLVEKLKRKERERAERLRQKQLGIKKTQTKAERLKMIAEREEKMAKRAPYVKLHVFLWKVALRRLARRWRREEPMLYKLWRRKKAKKRNMLNINFFSTTLIWFTIALSLLLFHTRFNVFSDFFFQNFYVDTLSILIIITTAITLFICFIIADNKYNLSIKWLLLLFFSFFIFTTLLVTTNNIISFFVYYELLLLPSYLLVKYSSPNRRSNIVANYFLFWTQFGSFLALLGIFLYITNNQLGYFSSYNATLLNYLFQVLIFLGFAVKIPLWPFHFWLSKTHVEANTGFSIFLSGILVKAAVFGLYKFSFLFQNNITWFFLAITIISIIDSSLKMCIQIDLKKLVAFSTIQEMGMMVLLLLFPSYTNSIVLYVFVIFHTLISGLFFFYVDCMYRRLNTRVSYNISGLSNLFPNLSLLLILGIYLFIGLPLTIKFTIEVHIIKTLVNYNLILLIIISFLANYLSIIFFFKTFITTNFGSIPNIKGVDLTKKEYLIVIFLIIAILTLSMF